MTGPSAAPSAGGPRSKSRRPEGRTVGWHELARHARFAEISPEVGVLDEQAMGRALAEDPTAFELLAAMTTATDERLRAAAIRLSSRIVLDRARAGRASMRGVSRLRPARGATDGDLDIDASIEGVSAARTEARPVGHDDLTTVHWARPRTAFAVVVDRSGSMSGPRLAAASTLDQLLSARLVPDFPVPGPPRDRGSLPRIPPRAQAVRFGQSYDIKLGGCLWHIYRMIGKLSYRIYLTSACATTHHTPGRSSSDRSRISGASSSGHNVPLDQSTWAGWAEISPIGSMAEPTSERSQDEAQDEAGLDTRHAHSARVYNYWLGGKGSG
jgi:hypothetical protein